MVTRTKPPSVTPIIPQKERGLVVRGQPWYVSERILRLAPQNDNIEASCQNGKRDIYEILEA